MNTFTPPRGILAILMITISCFFALPMQAQTIQIDSTFTSDGEIFPFGPNDTIYGLSISGSVTLLSDTSLVRVILTDNSGQEWMVYEAYPFVSSRWTFDIREAADETMYRQIIYPHSLKIQIINASLDLDSAILQNRYRENLENLQENFKSALELKKADSINQVIALNQMLWFAHRNPVSDLSYDEKSARFGAKYNLLGLDYYSGGIYDGRPGVDGPAYNSELVDSFDWRNRHGANDPLKGDYYYDEESTGNGWITSVKDQSPFACDGTCYIYGPLAAIEGVANLYFNQHIDYDLSEQHVLDCDTQVADECEGGSVDPPFTLARNYGIFDENCYPRDSTHGNCRENQLPNGPPLYRVKIAGTISPDYSNITEANKDSLINFGPLLTVVDQYYNQQDHAMAMVGYGKLKAYDIFYIPANPREPIVVDSGSQYIGKLYWIFKNSWGAGWGENGYFNHLSENIHFDRIAHIKLPIDDILTTSDVIQAYDKDHDGYWNWGISKDFVLPEGACSDLEDSDDSENRIGPFDTNYYGTPIKPEPKVYLNSGQSIDPMYVTNNSFLSFSRGDLVNGQELHFYIENTGTAQLNLFPVGIIGEGKVEIDPVNGASENYDISRLPQRKVCMEDANEFIVTFTGQEQGELTKIKIFFYENGDIPDFEFILVYNDCQPATELETISTDQTWDTFALKNSDYLVTNGATLTITGEIAMVENSDIFVAAGAKIKLDGGRLTSSCNSLWNGIDVWGDDRMPQFGDYQGRVEILNGGTIEFAKTGISTAHFLGIYPIPSGGIISCINGIFRDNIIDMEFYPFANSHPINHTWLPNFSRFIKTRFETTEGLYNIFSEIPDRHLAMDGVDGIYIYGCTFGNYSSQMAGSRGIGLESNQSGYTIDRLCIDNLIYPCTEWQPCLFENLDFGVRALNGIGRYPITVNNTDFIDNYMGIFLGLVYDATIIRNNFELNADDDYFQSGEKLMGIYSQYCPRYQIEENTITGGDPEHFELVGMHIVNSGAEYYNEIYNNILTNLDNGITASGENRDEDGKGLCIKCNDFIACNTDVAVLPFGGESPKKLGIAFLQGDIAPEPPEGQDPDQTISAGNTFSIYNSSEINYTNDPACNPIQYTSHEQNPGHYKITPEPTEPQQPSDHIKLITDPRVSYSKLLSCPSNFGGGGITPLVESNILSNELVLVEKYKDTLIMYVDGGDTQSLQSQVQTSDPDEALSIEQQLIDESPYLSDTVMITAIAKADVLPNAMIRDVLTLNPQSAKNDHILDKLEERMIPMPDYMIDEIRQNENIFGPKELLEQKLVHHKSKRDISLAKLCQYYKNDTVNTAVSFDSLESLLFNTRTLGTRYELLLQHLNKNDSVNSFSTINDIPLSFDLTSQQYNELTLYEELTNILFAINKDSVRFDTTSINSLYDMYLTNSGIPSEFSKYFLVYHHYLSFNEPIYFPSTLKTSPVIKHHVIQAKKNDLINAYPNPCKNYIILDYNIPENHNLSNNIKLTDLQGRSLRQVELTDFKNQIILPVSDLADGIYLIQLLTGNQLKKTVKFSILK